MLQRLELPGADLAWCPDFLPDPGRTLALVLEQVPFEQRSITMFGRVVAEPRLTSWHGDPGASYRYSGRRNEPLPWPPVLGLLREHLQHVLGTPFNSVLANLYRDGRDAMGWHADDERELGPQPVIASISVGGVRRMQFRCRPKGPIALSLELPSGSLLVMSGATQRRYHHRVPPTAREVAARVNLTYRMIVA